MKSKNWLDNCNPLTVKNTLKICIFILFSLGLHTARALDVYDDFGNAIRSGDARQVAIYFGNTIDLTLLNQEDIYSKAQAEQILRDFFSKNSPKSFTIVHKGSSQEGTLYGIGTLTSSNAKTYRVSFYMKTVNGKNSLLELRIESE
ncbi:MAG: DUF4783 domain-containing protein [Bacteroidetes bacterium]|nr:MAG: DUF4783 domain-containing protein [Bacteroidota bacterium]